MRNKIYNILISLSLLVYGLCVYSGITGNIGYLHARRQLRLETRLMDRWVIIGVISSIILMALVYMKKDEIHKNSKELFLIFLPLFIFMIEVVQKLLIIKNM